MDTQMLAETEVVKQALPKVELDIHKLVQQIRENYPNPTSVREPKCDSEQYCVGGAMMKFFGEENRFPDFVTLGLFLIKMNPSLSDGDALTYAVMITSKNDNYHFEESWGFLEAALYAKP